MADSALSTNVMLADGTVAFVAPVVGADPVSPTQLATAQWVMNNAGGFAWQSPVISATTTAQPGHVSGARYLLPASPTGAAWTGNGNKIALDSGSAWTFITPTAGYVLVAIDTSVVWVYTTLWEDISTLLTHNLLAALQGGTGGQYYHLGSAPYTALTSSQGAKLFYATPNGGSGTPAMRAILGTDISTSIPTSVGGLGTNVGSSTGYPLFTSGSVAFSATIPWGSITGAPSGFTPAAHAATHQSGGSDQLALDATQISTGQIALARGGTAVDATNITAALFFAGPTSSSGPAAFRAIGPDDVSGASAANQVLQRNSANTHNVWGTLAALTGYVPVTRDVNTTGYLSGGGNLSADLTLSWQGIDVGLAGTTIARRPIINFIQGSQTKTTVVDNPGNNRVDVTVSNSYDPVLMALVYASS